MPRRRGNGDGDVTDYGTDTSCTTTLSTGRMVTGARLVAEAIYRRLTTPRGMLRGSDAEQNYGLDLSDLIGSATTKADIAALPGRIESEVMKDERMESVDVSITDTTDGVGKSFLVAITGVTGAGPFELKVAISELTTELVGIKEG